MALPLLARRLLIPVLIAFEVLLLLGLALAAVIGLLVGLADRRLRLLKVALMGMAYVVAEVLALISFAGVWALRPFRPRGWYDRVNLRILVVALGAILGAGRVLLGFRVVVEDPPSPSPLDHREPVIVLARHGGIGDSYALVWLLAGRYQRRPRVVLKEVLLWEPLLDVALNRLGASFLSRRTDRDADPASQIGILARDLGAGDALLLFPEGGNWTPRRRLRAIARLRADRKPEASRKAQLMEHVLPPHPDGVLACLQTRPDLAVVVFAHTGLDKITSVAAVWDAIPFRTPMTVRWWPAVPPPPDPEGQRNWLTTEWAVVDEWIDAAGAGPQSPPQSG
jgi:1-acyl-sn-glycerol-3-phosphate acyltransferase